MTPAPPSLRSLLSPDDIITQPLTVISIVVYMLKTDWHFTLYSLCFFPLCLLPITIFGRRVRKIGRQDETSNAELMVILHEALAGIRLVKSLCREPHGTTVSPGQQ